MPPERRALFAPLLHSSFDCLSHSSSLVLPILLLFLSFSFDSEARRKLNYVYDSRRTMAETRGARSACLNEAEAGLQSVYGVHARRGKRGTSPRSGWVSVRKEKEQEEEREREREKGRRKTKRGRCRECWWCSPAICWRPLVSTQMTISRVELQGRLLDKSVMSHRRTWRGWILIRGLRNDENKTYSIRLASLRVFMIDCYRLTWYVYEVFLLNFVMKIVRARKF